MVNDKWTRWIVAGLFGIIIALIGTVYSFTVTDADIKDFVTREEAIQIVKDYSPYALDKRGLEEQLKAINCVLEEIKVKIDRMETNRKDK